MVYVIWARVVGDVITVLCIEGERRALEVKRMEGKRTLVREPLLLPRELRVAPARVPVRTPNRQTRSVSAAKEAWSFCFKDAAGLTRT